LNRLTLDASTFANQLVIGLQRMSASPVANRLQQAIALGFLRVSLAVGRSSSRDEPWPMFGCSTLVKSIIRIGTHLVALPGRLARPLAFRLWAVAVILMTHTALTQIPAAAADNLFHGRHRYLVSEG